MGTEAVPQPFRSRPWPFPDVAAVQCVAAAVLRVCLSLSILWQKYKVSVSVPPTRRKFAIGLSGLTCVRLRLPPDPAGCLFVSVSVSAVIVCFVFAVGEKVSQMLTIGVQAGYLNSEQDYDSEVQNSML